MSSPFWWPRFGPFVLATCFLAFACSAREEISSSLTPDEEAPRAATDATTPPCTPQVGGLTLAGVERLAIVCPAGQLTRESESPLPIAGRFTTADQLATAFCEPAPRASSGSALASGEDSTDAFGIDFSKNDVVIRAYDASAGTPVVYRRGQDLWLQVHTDSCHGDAPDLASFAFVVPKQAKVAEQTCSRPCGSGERH